MPTLQMPPDHAPFRPDSFRTSIRQVQTSNYNKRVREIGDQLSGSREQSTYLTIKYGLIDALEALDRISGMEKNWDSYGSEPPSADAIRASKETLDQLAGELLLPSTIVPSAEGGVSIYFMTGSRTAYVESYNQGSQSLVMYDEDDGSVEVLNWTRHSGF